MVCVYIKFERALKRRKDEPRDIAAAILSAVPNTFRRNEARAGAVLILIDKPYTLRGFKGVRSKAARGNYASHEARNVERRY